MNLFSNERSLKVQNPAVHIVQRLKDKDIPLYGMVHEVGKVRTGATIAGLTIAKWGGMDTIFPKR
jgi:hypothetical protein